MILRRCASVALAAVWACSPLQAQSEAAAGAATAARGVLKLNVVVNDGAAPNLEAAEVQLLDNGAPVRIQSFQPVAKMGTPTHVILVIDDVNARLTTIAYEREELKKFFLRRDGQLPFPFTLAVMTDTKTEIQQGSSQSGAQENESLQKYEIGLHELRRDAQYAGFDRTNIALHSLEQLVQYAASIPGRKLILFVSPGWPLLSGPGIVLSAKEQNSIFATVARLQDSMLDANVTLDMLNPLGPEEGPGRADYFESFLKGAKKPGDAEIADLSLQVLTTHIGGSVQQGSSDIAGMVQRALDEVSRSYSLAFVPPISDSHNGYHSLKLQISRPGVTARTADEYYTQTATEAPPTH